MCNGVSIRVEKKTTSTQDDEEDGSLAPDGLPKKIKGSGVRGPKSASPAAPPSSNPLRTPAKGEGLQVPGMG